MVDVEERWTEADGRRGLGGGWRFEGDDGWGEGILSWLVACWNSVETLRNADGFAGRLGGSKRLVAS